MVVSILLYVCTTRTVSVWRKAWRQLCKNARAILNKTWWQQPTKLQLYGYPPHITKTIPIRRTRHVVHCGRNKDEIISDILLWTPSRGRAKAERPAWAYIQLLCADTGYSLEDLSGATDDRDGWRERVKDIRAGSTTLWWLWNILS